MLSHLDGGIIDNALSLEEFYLDHNELKGVPSKSLKGPNALKILDLSYNQIDELRPDDFAQAVSLIMVNMSKNEIGVIQGGAFRGMSSLKVVDLSWNRLLRLSSDSFMGLASIEEIDVSNNFLSQIPITSMKILPTLKVLRMGSNLLQNLEGTVLKQLPNLEMVDLSRNRLSEIPKGFFSGLSRLREVNLGVNQLRTIPTTVFEGLPYLEKVNLMDNNLLTFPAAALENLHGLNTLILDYNRISALQPSQPSNLTELSLAHNLIREIPPETFKSFPNMTYLNLQGNQVASVEELALPLSLLELNLGSNQLRTIPRFQLPNLEILNLKGNQVGALLQHNFVLLGNIRELNLQNNMISSFFSNSFDGLDALLDLDMSGNKLEFLPKFGNLLDLEILNFSRNHLKEIGSIENMDALKLLDLSSNQLTNLNADIFKNTSSIISLYLQDNKLTSFRGFSGKFDRLKTLDLHNNQISYVYPNSFESFGNLWNLNMNQNRFSLFPTEFLKPCKQLRYIGLSKNHLKNLNEMNFSNFPFLRELDLSGNAIELVIPNAFLNSTQLQKINLSGNKLENLDSNIFRGLLRLELDLSDNYLSSLPPTLFDRGHVQKLQEIKLSRNSFASIPSDALQKQYFYLEELHLAENKITSVAPNLNILVNVKSLDLSFNPLDDASLKNILNEPKTVRILNLANCSIKALPILEMPFLRELNLSGNSLHSFGDTVFQRSTLLEKMDLSKNQFANLDYTLPPSLKQLSLSSNPLTVIAGGNFPQSLQSLKLNSLPSLLKVEKSALVLKNLVELELYDLPKLGYLDIRGILTNVNFLEGFDFEVKDTQIVDQLHPGLTARVNRIGLRGRRVRSISTGAFAGLTSPSISISLINTSLSLLPSILVPVPMSSQVMLDLTGSKITNLSPPFLSQNIQLRGLVPTCDCNAVNLVRYLQATETNNVFCGAPRKLEGTSVLSLTPDDLTCDSGSSTTSPPEPSSISTTTTTSTTPTPSTTDDIIWSVAPSTKSSSKSGKQSSKTNKKVLDASNKSKSEVNNMDSLIFGIVGGVIVLIVLFVIIIVCFVKLSNSSSSTDGIYPPAAPSVVSMGPHQIYGPVGTLGSKCTCSGGNKGHPHHMHPHGGYMMTSAGPYGTVRSNVGKIYGGGGGIYAVQQGQAGPPSLHSLSGMPMSMGPPSLSPYVNATYANSGPASLRHHHQQQHHHHQQQQQQQMQYSSNMQGYYGQDSDYESRR
ncbi:SLIT and NTRK-like protein 5 isoform X2 [Folsomia candida]|nr:SLIT and NTRK-like protein 5 isoform X2 [Folsomia candida]